MRRLFLLTSTILILTLIVTIGIGYSAFDNLSSTQKTKTEQTKTLGVETQEIPSEQEVPYATLTIDAGEGIESSYILDAKEGTSAYSLLETAEEMGEIKMETEQYDFGVFVKSINGFENSNDKVWIYFVNEKSGDVAADQYFIKSGDKVEWKYINPSE